MYPYTIQYVPPILSVPYTNCTPKHLSTTQCVPPHYTFCIFCTLCIHIMYLYIRAFLGRHTATTHQPPLRSTLNTYILNIQSVCSISTIWYNLYCTYNAPKRPPFALLRFTISVDVLIRVCCICNTLCSFHTV